MPGLLDAYGRPLGGAAPDSQLGGYAPRVLCAGNVLPEAPAEYSDAVTLYARNWGRVGKLVFEEAGHWSVKLSLTPDDPRSRTEDPWETIPLLFWDPNAGTRRRNGHMTGAYEAYALDDLGIIGLLEFLEKGNTFSGRGQFDSHTQAFRTQREKRAQARAATRRRQAQEARDNAADKRRSILAVPFLGVGEKAARVAATHN